MKPLIIGIGSKARIGKDYAAKELAKIYSLERVAFADELKKDLAEIFAKSGINYWELETNPIEKEKVRPLLVEYGCTMRKFDADIWVKRAFAAAKFDKEIVFVTDVRFPNEADYIKKLGGVFIDIETDIPPANEVEAENAPKMRAKADFVVINRFDSNFIKNLVTLVEQLRSPLCQTQSEKSNHTPSVEIATNSSTLTQAGIILSEK